MCVLSSTSVEVHWKPPHFLHQNGIITGYWIGIAELVSFPLFIFNTTSVNLVVIISGKLHVFFVTPNSEYNIQLCIYTVMFILLTIIFHAKCLASLLCACVYIG